MKGNTDTNALFRASHMMILVTYTIMFFALTAEIMLMNWEKWAVVLIGSAVCGCWYLHLKQMFTDRQRLTLYVVCMMVTIFFYGTHPTSTFDMGLVMCVCIILCCTTGIKAFVTLCQITYFATFAYDMIAILVNEPESLDGLVISRVMLHVLLILLAGWLGRLIIDRWAEVLEHSRAEVEQLQQNTGRLNDFLTSVSHEIRTPINAVTGLSGICLERTEDPEQEEHLQAIQAAGGRVTELIGDVLDYADLDRKRITLNQENYMLSSVLHDVVVELEPYMHRDVELIIDVDPNIPAVMYSDVAKLKKILWHLGTNALKFTKSGGAYMHVYSEPHDYGVNLMIDLSDTGVGMEEQAVERLFDGYYQASADRARSSGGLGLGIAIVAGFIHALGGFINMESRPGVGTDVRVSLPMQVVDSSPCMSVRDPEQLVLGGFLHFDKFAEPRVREYYNTMVRNIVRGLGVQMHRVDNLEALRKLVESIRLTHLFVGEEEYASDIPYMENLAKTVSVTVVAEEGFTLPAGSAARVMQKPFYCFPVAALLNREPGESAGERHMYCRGVRALVVDDEPLNLTVARNILRRYGIQVSTAGSGAEAIELCGRETFDLVFMDHMMPGMDGIEAMQRIRTAAAWKSVPMVALTANAASQARSAFRAAGFDGFLAKPIEFLELERVLRTVLPESRISFEDTPHSRPDGKGRSAQGAPAVPVSAPEPEDPYAPMRALGVDIRQGQRYCQDDDEFYRSLLGQFAAEAGEKRREMETLFGASDLPGYAIRIHALKSTAKMIGANSLSEKARTLEAAAKEGREEEVRSGHPGAMAEYDALTRAIRSVVGGEEVPAGGTAPEPGPEDGVLEFSPEEDVLEFGPEKDPPPEAEILEFGPEGGEV